MKINFKFYFVSIVVLSAFLSGCFNEGGGGQSEPEPNNSSSHVGTVSGQVFNGITGQAVSGITVSIDEQSTVTEAEGRYTLQNIELSERVVVTTNGSNFAKQSKIIRITQENPEVHLPIRVLPVQMTQVFDPNTAQVLSPENSTASVNLIANSLVQADGSSPVGDVTINLTTIDPTLDIELMPGDMQTSVGGVLSPIESFGAMAVTFTDSSGNDLDLSQGSTATIRIPLADKSGNPPAMIPLYFYDDEEGIWVEEGSATLMTDALGSYYQGDVAHFTTWNADDLFEQVIINGCIENIDGDRLLAVKIISSGEDYSGTSASWSDASGNFSIIVKSNASVLLHGLFDGEKTNTVGVSTTTSEQTLGACLVLQTDGGIDGSTAISIKLSWGEKPEDLDGHLAGPTERIYYDNKGNLAEFPFMHLDVDNTESFGPEVITVFKFSEPGIYRYSVNNYSDTFEPGITGSPARVELNVNGDITIFTPPLGENNTTTITWDVFEFVVADDGSFTINTINTWSDSFPL
ncbi:hypothetical protein MNBD_GAMMA03-256 [hydrothermal vent metagenome]|uniref:Carboxypeptidase regulatory-like domain-containing protein n=1 Tax=hydrothermal vent metagenome TaxID=652676 RepID=A0A3B0VZI3_9ZZZZ